MVSKPYWVDENGVGIVEWPMLSGSEKEKYSKKYGHYTDISFRLGPFFVSVGKFLQKNKDVIKKVIHKNVEITYLAYIAWMTKTALNKNNIEISFENVISNIGGRKKKILGQWNDIINTQKLLEIIQKADIHTLRELAEIFASANLHLSDIMYQIDFGTDIGNSEICLRPTDKVSNMPSLTNRISTWQSYGRYSLRLARKEFVEKFAPKNDEVVLVPCTSSKPYYEKISSANKSGQKILKFFKENPNTDKIVVTTIGVVPEQFWKTPIDLGYDTGVPDLWADYLSLKKLFKMHGDKWKKVHVFLNYGPYVEMIHILKALGIIRGEIIWHTSNNLHKKKGNYGAFFYVKQDENRAKTR